MVTGDAENYRLFINGNKIGIQKIVETYRNGLILYINIFVKNINDAEDLAVDVFALLLVKKPVFKGQSSFKTWLYSIARHLALNYIKKNSHTDFLCDETISDDTQDVERAYLQQEQKLMINRAMEKLNDEYRQVLYLSYFEELSNAEISRIMKKNRRQVENLLYRARQSLRKILIQGGFECEIIQ